MKTAGHQAFAGVLPKKMPVEMKQNFKDVASVIFCNTGI